jgi:hypothetical protein
MDYLLATGWKQVTSISAGVVCAVKGDEDWGHAILGVGNGIIDAHNNANYHLPISDFAVDLCLTPPS